MTRITDLDHEPTDPAARIIDENGDEWVRRRDGRWTPLRTVHGGQSWAGMRVLMPDAEVNVPQLDTGRVIPGRRSDPATSTPAAPTVIRANTQRHRLLAAFGRAADGLYPSRGEGLTDEEAMQRSDGVPATSEYAKRCSELRDAGLIEPTGATRQGGSGAARIVSRLTEKGAMVLARLSV